MKKIKSNIKIEELDQDMLKDVLMQSLEQNEKQLCVYLIQQEVEGESEDLVAKINGIYAYTKKMKKVLITKFG